MKLFIGYKAWKAEEYLLNRMTFRDLTKAYVTYPAIQVYTAIVLISLGVAAFTFEAVVPTILAFAAGAMVFPLSWYITHRFILHGSWMYKTPFLASFWKRIHYDHHRYPNDLSVLFGGLHTTIPPIMLIAGPIGFALSGLAGAAAAIAGMVIMTMYTEFMHAGEHLAFEPKSKFWKDMKSRHLAHHFHDETGNFGIAEFFWDRLFGTFYAQTSERPRSACARNLGYTDEMAQKFPWVKALDDAEVVDRPGMRGGAA